MNLSQPESVNLSTHRLARIRPVMQAYVDQGKLAGTLTLVARRGQVVHLESCGLQEVATMRPMSPQTIFRIYSMTKPITSVAAMMLLEEGRLHLSDPVHAYLPQFKDLQVWEGMEMTGMKLVKPRRPMTIQHLLTHTAGLSYGWFEDSPVEALYRERDTRSVDGEAPTAELVNELGKLPLLFHPGEAWRYSLATDVLGHLVELISGQRLGDFFQERIFQPLGMVDTAFHVPADKIGRFAANYGPADEGEGLKLIDGTSDSLFARSRQRQSGGGGLVGTATDYFRFCQMLLNRGELDGQRLLGRKSVEVMTLNHLPEQLMPIQIGGESVMPGCGFGLGFRVVMDVPEYQRLASVGEYGWGGAADTYFWIDPEEELIGIFMTQLMPSGTYPASMDFRNLVYQSLL